MLSFSFSCRVEKSGCRQITFALYQALSYTKQDLVGAASIGTRDERLFPGFA